MKSCHECEQANPEEAVYCLRCGSRFGEAAAEPAAEARDEEQLWRLFIGQTRALTFSFQNGWQWESADRYYLRKFKSFQKGEGPTFALTWNWAPFLVTPFLWFLYRKMYLYAAVYFIGPILGIYLTQDPNSIFVWAVVAGGTGNYIYYWHIRDHIRRLREEAGPSGHIPDSVLRDAGGVQPYVFVLGIILHLFVVLMILQGPPAQNGPDAGGALDQEPRRVF